MKLNTLIFFFVFLIGILQAIFVIDLEIMTSVVGIISYLFLICFILIYSKLNIKSDFEYYHLMQLFLIIGIIEIIIGLIQPKNYWDWKFMIFNTALLMFIPIVSFIGSAKDVTQVIFYNFIKYMIPISFLVFVGAKHSINTDAYGRFLSPLYYVLLFFPFLTKKWKVFILLLMVASFLSDFGARSNMIRILAVSGLMLSYYFRSLIHKNILKTLLLIFFIAPVVLFILGVSNIFNIFQLGQNNSDKYAIETTTLANGEERDDNLVGDTRTFIYEEEISSSIYRNTWLFGESANAGYISPWFDDGSFGTKGRSRSEVCILNIFNVYGIIGVIIFSLILFYASSLCVNHSNNYICKLLGLFIAFRWSYTWVEEFYDMDINFIFLWLMIGLCFSKSFRNMDDDEMKTWVLGIFNKKYTENPDLIKTRFILTD